MGTWPILAEYSQQAACKDGDRVLAALVDIRFSSCNYDRIDTQANVVVERSTSFIYCNVLLRPPADDL